MARKKYSLRKAREMRELPTIELLDGNEYQIKSGLNLSTNERLEMEQLQDRMSVMQADDHDEENVQNKMTDVFNILCDIARMILNPAPSQDLLDEMTLEDFMYLQEVFLEISEVSNSTLSTGMEREMEKAASRKKTSTSA